MIGVQQCITDIWIHDSMQDVLFNSEKIEKDSMLWTYQIIIYINMMFHNKEHRNGAFF